MLDQSLFVTLFAVASDDREGLVLSGPPLASWDRPTTITLRFPPVPPGTGWVPDFSVNMLRQDKATVAPAVVEDQSGGGNRLHHRTHVLCPLLERHGAGRAVVPARKPTGALSRFVESGIFWPWTVHLRV